MTSKKNIIPLIFHKSITGTEEKFSKCHVFRSDLIQESNSTFVY